MLRRAIAHMKKQPTAQGFTLVELLVVMTLILIITTYSIAGYFPFITKIEYENVVMDIALNIREHQIYGIGTKQVSADVFSYAYGLYVEPRGTSILFFKDSVPDNSPVGTADDTDGNGLNDAGMSCDLLGNPECLKIIQMNGYSVESISLVRGSNPPIAATNPVHVTFKRPYLDAKILSGGVQYDQASFCVLDDAGVVDRLLKIDVFRTGQISVRPMTDPVNIATNCI